VAGRESQLKEPGDFIVHDNPGLCVDRRDHQAQVEDRIG